jgi:hypothetical protein
MRNHLSTAVLYANLYAMRATSAAYDLKQKAVVHKSEMIRLGCAAVVVGIAARANGFQAGYEFAQNS